MAEGRWERLAAATGIAFPLLYVAAGWLIGGAGGDTKDGPEAVLRDLLDNDLQMGIGVGLGGLAAAALLWFSGSLRASLRRAEGDAGRLSAVAFAAGVLGAAMILVGILTAGGAAFELADYQGNAVGAQAFFGISFVFAFLGLALALGVMLLASGIVSLRTGVLPKWLGWTGAVLGVIFVLGWWLWLISIFGGILVLLWVIAVAIVLMRRAGVGAAG